MMEVTEEMRRAVLKHLAKPTPFGFSVCFYVAHTDTDYVAGCWQLRHGEELIYETQLINVDRGCYTKLEGGMFQPRKD